MKVFKYIIPIILVVASSCSSQLFTGVTYDDLYYRPSDNPVVAQESGAIRTSDQPYYDNIFAGDTLIADEFEPYEEYSEQEQSGSVINNYYGVSPSDQIFLFSDNYFYPYWTDPFYFSPFGSSFYFGYNYYGWPYSSWYSPYWYDSYYYSPYYYSSFYNPYYSPWGYGYNPWYYTGYYGSWYPGNDISPLRSGDRRGGYSTMSSGSGHAGNPRNAPAAGYSSLAQSKYASRRSPSTSLTASDATKSAASVSPDNQARRTAGSSTASGYQSSSLNSTTQNPGYTNRQASGTLTQNPGYTNRQASGVTTRTGTGTTTSSQSVNRPQYQTTERSYTPSYNNPRMSSKPSYNNSRTTTTPSGNTSSGYNRSSGSSAPAGSTYNRSSSSSQPRSSYSSGSSSGSSQTRSSSSVQYSAPSRSSSSSSGSSSRGSSSSSSSGSSSSRSSSSYSSGSSSSGSSHSSGSSSSGSSSYSSSGGSGGRR